MSNQYHFSFFNRQLNLYSRSDPKYYSLTSHGEVVRFVTGEFVLPKQVLPEWILDNLEYLQEFRDLPGGGE